MTVTFDDNLAYLRDTYPQLLNVIHSTSVFKKNQALDKITNDELKNYEQECISTREIIRITFDNQLAKTKHPQRLLLPRVQSSINSGDSKDAFSILKKSIDSSKSLLLDSLPNLSKEIYNPDSQNNYLAKDVVLTGALGLVELDSIINSCTINNLLLIDDGYESLAKLLELTSFQAVIEKCKSNNISLHFLIEEDYDSLINLVKKQIACEMFSSCFGFYLFVAPPASAILESVIKWLKSQEGLGEFQGLPDKKQMVNQSIHSILTIGFI